MTPKDEEGLLQADMFDPSGTTLERTLPGDFTTLRPRRVWLEDGVVRWEWPLRPIWRTPGAGTVAEFIGLADATDDEIVRFVRRHGPLVACPCGRPWHHPAIAEGPKRCRGPRAEPYDAEHTSEPLAVWRCYSRRARSLLRLAVAIHRGRETSAGADWNDLVSTGEAAPSDVIANLANPIRRRFPYGRGDVAEVIDEWLAWSGVRPSFAWEPVYDPDADPNQTLDPERNPSLVDGKVPEPPPPWFVLAGGDGLLPFIGVHAATAVARVDSVFTCDECGELVVPKRRPAAGRNVYCPRCAKRGNWKQAQRRLRERRRNTDGT